mmetsp:Transcript_2111/g.4758  ORF Transcript_2111/g.4758 Transcript_2111/m.4758 type:complete len:87 (+) Transcript_2111:813-1073(+)
MQQWAGLPVLSSVRRRVEQASQESLEGPLARLALRSTLRSGSEPFSKTFLHFGQGGGSAKLGGCHSCPRRSNATPPEVITEQSRHW